jgi:transposase
MERKEYTRHSRESKLEAVRLAAIGERPKAQIARELGIRVNQLRKWRLEFEQEERTGAPKQILSVDGDLVRPRRENAKLREENELKKRPSTSRWSRREVRVHRYPPTQPWR